MIPRPPAAVAGGPAPWALVPEAARRGITVRSVVGALRRAERLLVDGVPPDGLEPELVVDAPVVGGPGRAAAVLVGLFDDGGGAHVLLTKRSSTLRSHRGQVSFPGGRIDDGEGAVSAAVREAWEEVGLDPALVRPVAALRPVVSGETGTHITPVVGTLDGRPQELVANPDEVARVFDVSLGELAASFREERWTRPEQGTWSVYFFDVAGETVWGATARMLVDLLTVTLLDGA